MREYIKKLFGKKQGEPAREMYYLQVSNQMNQAREAIRFIDEARKRGYCMRLHIEVDGVFCPSGEIILERAHGLGLLEYMYQWFVGTKFIYGEELAEMKRLWPDIAAIAGTPETAAMDGLGGGTPQIAPEGP